MQKIRNYLQHIKVDAALSWSIIIKEILQTNYIFVFAGLFMVILMTLQWLFNLDQLIYVFFQQENFTILDKIQYILDGFANIFIQWQNIVPVSLIAIALLQSLAITLLIKMRTVFRKHTFSSLSLSVLGAGCVACGGSILVPLITFFFAGATVSLIRTFGNILLVLAVVLSYQAFSRIVIRYATQKYGK